MREGSKKLSRMANMSEASRCSSVASVCCRGGARAAGAGDAADAESPQPPAWPAAMSDAPTPSASSCCPALASRPVVIHAGKEGQLNNYTGKILTSSCNRQNVLSVCAATAKLSLLNKFFLMCF